MDETLCGHCKFHRGKPTTGVWIVGGVEKTEERKFFFVAVEDRSAETLESIIRERVHLDSRLTTDCWSGYNNAGSLVAEHLTVNHSEEFLNEGTGACTNMIEGTWTGLKRWIPKIRWRMGAIFDDLLEYVWRREHHGDLWNALWRALASMEYEPVPRNPNADEKRKRENAEADALLKEKKETLKVARAYAADVCANKRTLQKHAQEDEDARMQLALERYGFDSDEVEAVKRTTKELMAPVLEELANAHKSFLLAQKAFDSERYAHREGVLCAPPSATSSSSAVSDT